MKHCPRCGGPTVTGPPLDLGGCVNVTVRCDACDVDLEERSTRKDEPMAKKPKVKPRDQDLPGMEDRAIRTLELLAHDYADVRDERMELAKKEKAAKDKVADEMRRLDRTEYHRKGIDITIEDSVKVKVKKRTAAGAEDLDAENAPAIAAGDELRPDVQAEH